VNTRDICDPGLASYAVYLKESNSATFGHDSKKYYSCKWKQECKKECHRHSRRIGYKEINEQLSEQFEDYLQSIVDTYELEKDLLYPSDYDEDYYLQLEAS